MPADVAVRPAPTATATVARRSHLRTVFAKALRDERRGLIGWSIGMAAFGGYLLAAFPTIRHNPELKRLLESYPEAMRKMLSLRDFTTGPGYLQGEVFSFMAPLLLVMVGVLYGSDATSGEEERRTIDLLLANPVPRWRVVADKAAAMATALVVVSAALYATLAVGDVVLGMGVSVAWLGAAVLASFLFALDMGMLALALGAVTGRRGLSRGVVAVVAVASYLVFGLADLVKALRPLRPFSLFYQSLGREPLFTGFAPWRTLVLVGVALALAALAAVAFERRDLTS